MSDESQALATPTASTPPDAEEPPADGPLAVPLPRLLQDWKQASDRAIAYLEALGVPAAERAGLAAAAVERAVAGAEWAADGDALTETLRALSLVLMQRYPAAPRPWDGALEDHFAAWRLDAAVAGRCGGGETPDSASAATVADRFSAMPPLRRGAMVPEPVEHRLLRRIGRRLRGGPGLEPRPDHPVVSRRERARWRPVAVRRRLMLMVLVLIPSIVASGFMVNVLPHHGGTWLEVAIVAFFGALFGWISIGFWTALLGFFTLLRARDRFAITNLNGAASGPIDPGTRTAIVMPICHEPVDRVFAGLRAIYSSVERAGGLEHFHFFVLSDSNVPDTCMREEEAWLAWCRDVGGFGRIFYRRRKVRLRRKSGNVADFCRRWGRAYPYMIMLDADSVMSGETLVRLVQLMEQHSDVGMIQTAPTAVNRRSLFARVQQFASRVYGPMFAAGLHFWQLGDGQYWGHNAIIRIKPFMDHCGLPRLPGKPPLGGEILSHDFVEAALMGRSGWSLWLAYDLPGSYEETPSTLLEEMGRDRRWCQGNLQHLRLLFSEGLNGAHRALFINGVLSYVSAMMWFGFLTLSTAEAIHNALQEPDYFPHGASLFPEWPVWRPDWALSLLAVTGMILFLPKFLSVFLIALKRREAKLYGGVIRLSLSVVIEILLSSLFAPIRMLFHTKFVFQNLLGRTVSWSSQGRGDDETAWGVAIRRHGLDTLFATAWGISLYLLNPDYFWWVTPILGGLILSIPTSVLASRVSLGDRARAWRLFMIPEESAPPAELRDLAANLDAAERAVERLPPAERDGFARTAIAPLINAVHRAMLGRRRTLHPAIRAARAGLLERALAGGPSSLAAREQRVVLSDPDLVDTLHRRVWELPDQRAWRPQPPRG